jgi:hypothetical protein
VLQSCTLTLQLQPRRGPKRNSHSFHGCGGTVLVLYAQLNYQATIQWCSKDAYEIVTSASRTTYTVATALPHISCSFQAQLGEIWALLIHHGRDSNRLCYGQLAYPRLGFTDLGPCWGARFGPYPHRLAFSAAAWPPRASDSSPLLQLNPRSVEYVQPEYLRHFPLLGTDCGHSTFHILRIACSLARPLC